MGKVIAVILACFLCFVVVGGWLFFGATPTGKAMWNTWFHAVQKADDDTNYRTRKQVEDTCRSMIASYQADKLTFDQYAGSEDAEKSEWAEAAKMRANKTASTYNNYILRNSYVFQNNVPGDIFLELPYLE